MTKQLVKDVVRALAAYAVIYAATKLYKAVRYTFVALTFTGAALVHATENGSDHPGSAPTTVTSVPPSTSVAPVDVDDHCRQDPGFECGGAVTAGFAGTGNLHKPGQDETAYAFSRVQIDVPVLKFANVFGRVDVSRMLDGGTDKSWTSAEFYTGAYARLAPGLALAGMGGIAAPLRRGVVALERYPAVYGAGFFLGEPRGGRWLLALYGRHEASGDARGRLILAGCWKLRGNVYVMADGAPLGRNAFVRTQAAVGVE